MQSFEFEIANNITFAEGTVEGYFSAVHDSTQVPGAIRGTAFELEFPSKQLANNQCIPLILNEFGAGPLIGATIVERADYIPGFITFGAAETSQPMDRHMLTATHLAIMAREIKRDGFLASVCRIPGDFSVESWKNASPLLALNHHFGSLAITNNVCTVTVDESVRPLKPSL